jgi:hypothetical protein
MSKAGEVSLMSLFAGIGMMVSVLPTFGSQSVKLNWSPSTSPDVVGYNIYYGGANADYTNEISVGNMTNATVSGLLDHTTYFFSARTINSSGMESPYSIQTSYVVPTAAAMFGRPIFSSNGVSVTVKGVPGYMYVIQSSTDMINWLSLETNLTPLVFTDTNPSLYNKRFYRAVYLF